jgi:hypothetical protein
LDSHFLGQLIQVKPKQQQNKIGMKKLILCAALMAAVGSAFGQGQVGFANNAPQRITNSVTGIAAVGGSAQDDTQVGLYVGNVGDAVSSLQMIGNVTNCFAGGLYNGGTRTLAGWTGTVQLQVRSWLASTVYLSYEAAYAGALGGDGSVFLGVSAPQNYTLSVAPSPVISLGNSGGLTSITINPVIVPEPSSIALGLLGLGAVALFRRRK